MLWAKNHVRKNHLGDKVWTSSRKKAINGKWKRKENILQRYASVDKYDDAQGGVTSEHLKLWCACTTEPTSLYSVQYPVKE